jgi:hypothetical protein
MSRVDRAHRKALRNVLKDMPGRDAGVYECRDWYARHAGQFHDLREDRTTRTSRRGGER